MSKSIKLETSFWQSQIQALLYITGCDVNMFGLVNFLEYLDTLITIHLIVKKVNDNLLLEEK